MKKLVVSAVVAALAATALVGPAEAAKKRKPKARVAEGTYDNPAIGVPGVVGSAAAGGAFEFATLAGENTIAIEIDDAGGGSPTATLSQDTDPSTPSWEIFATICGRTEEPLPISPGIPVRVSIYTTPGPEQPTCTGPATNGTIVATFAK